MAQDAIDHALKTGKLGVQARPCATSHLKLVRAHRAGCASTSPTRGIVTLARHHYVQRLHRTDAPTRAARIGVCV